MSTAFRAFLLLVLTATFASQLLASPRDARAFDTAWHYGMTDEAFKSDAGWSEAARNIIAVGDWYVDYYAGDPLGDLKLYAAELHFDDLFTLNEVIVHWGWLQSRAALAFDQYGAQSGITGHSRKTCDPFHILLTMGLVLHAVQDFYSHSNWHTVDFTSIGLKQFATWDDVKDKNILKKFDIHTGAYTKTAPANREHHDVLDVDDPIVYGVDKSKEHSKALSFALNATGQWVSRIEAWVADDDCWAKVKTYTGHADDAKNQRSWGETLSVNTGKWDEKKSFNPFSSWTAPISAPWRMLKTGLSGARYKTVFDTDMNKEWKVVLNLFLDEKKLHTVDQTLILVVDASGSMGQAIPGGSQTKMEAAKAATKAVLADLPDGSEVGLFVYRGCDDIVFTNLSRHPATIARLVDQIHPVGETPMAAAIDDAREFLTSGLAGTTGSATLIVLSDGQENCGGTPVEAADGIRQDVIPIAGQPPIAARPGFRDYLVSSLPSAALDDIQPPLARAGYPMKLDTIGVGVTPEAELQLRQMAAAGGGDYYPANNTAQLRQALGSAVTGDDGGSGPLMLVLILGTLATLSVVAVIWVRRGQLSPSPSGARVSSRPGSAPGVAPNPFGRASQPRPSTHSSTPPRIPPSLPAPQAPRQPPASAPLPPLPGVRPGATAPPRPDLPPAPGTSACPSCGAPPGPPGARHCRYCGRSLVPEAAPPVSTACPACGALVATSASFCTSCGASIRPPP